MTGELYRILGVERGAGEADIKKAYRRLAKTSHPDLKPGDEAAEERFKKITRAYDILHDKDKRARYDRGLIDDEGNEVQPSLGGGFANAGAGNAGGFRFRTGGGGRGFGGFDDILNDLFGPRGAAGNTFAFETAEAPSPPPASFDTRYDLEIGFIEAALGGKRRVTLPSGRAIDLKIPAGAETGQIMRLRGQGSPDPTGAPGDLLVTLKVGTHPHFRREGSDILVDQAVPLAVAVKGGRVRVPTLSGEVSLKVPAWTTSGKTLRLKGRGVTGGDQLVRLLVDLPDTPDPALKDALERWAATQAA